MIFLVLRSAIARSRLAGRSRWNGRSLSASRERFFPGSNVDFRCIRGIIIFLLPSEGQFGQTQPAEMWIAGPADYFL